MSSFSTSSMASDVSSTHTAAQRQALQVEADELRDRLAAAQLATTMANSEINAERAKREAAEAKAKDLQGCVDKLHTETSKPSRRRRWWHF
jgi:regulator of replication initiation timing